MWAAPCFEPTSGCNLVAMHPQFLLAVVLCFAAALRLSAQDKVAIPLPRDGSTTIVVLDYRGGYGPERKNQEPVLAIHADGNATVVDPTDERPTRKYRLSAAEVEALLREIVQELDFFNIDHNEISRAMAEEDRKTGSSMSMFDASTTVIRIQTADRKHELRFNALGTWANRYPTIQPLQQLFNVEKRLERVIQEFTPNRKLSYTHYSPLMGKPDRPENYHTVTITLTPAGAKSRVSIDQDNNETAEAQQHSAKNWTMMLEGLTMYLG